MTGVEAINGEGVDLEEEITLSVTSIPFVRAVGVEFVSASRDACQLSVPVGPHFHTSPGGPQIAPGFIAGVLDQLGSCALTSYFGKRHAQATLSMSLSFAEDAQIKARETKALKLVGKAHFETGTTGAVAMTASDDEGAVLAHGLIDFMLGTYPGSSGAHPARDHTAFLDRDAFKPERVDADHFNAWMGLNLDLETSTLDFANRLVGSTGPVVAFHGGVLAAAAIGHGCHCAKDLGDFQLSHFSLEYLRAAKAGDHALHTLTLRAQVVRQSRRTLVMRVDIFQEDGARHVATTTLRLVN